MKETFEHGVATLFPGYFALVMATGIISIAAYRLDMPRIAWALLGRLRRGDAYVIDPVVLDGSGPWARDGRGATGAAHVALIEHAIEHVSDPRAGELAVRLAYMIEASKGTIAPSTPDIANQVAALVRDRALATQDLGDLLSAAAQNHRPVMQCSSSSAPIALSASSSRQWRR